MPNWLGDGVMATPFLRALRQLYPTAFISALHRPLVAAAVVGSPFVDEVLEYPVMGLAGKGKIDSRRTVALLRDKKFDLAVLLPNSFRAALLTWKARIPHRLGYAREWRTPLLTDRLRPVFRTAQQHREDKEKRAAICKISTQLLLDSVPRSIGSAYQPAPTIDYYLELARCLGATECDRRMELGVTEAERSEAQAALTAAGITDARPLAAMVPGANFGSSKCWPPERFAAIADTLVDPAGPYRANVILVAAPAEKPVIEAIFAACKNRDPGKIVWSGALADGKGLSVGALKEVVRRSRMMICNDTGPRHFAAAFNVPTVALFGPTDQRWAETYSQCEIALQVNVPCGPCQLKLCPIDHRCMKLLTVDMVLQSVSQLWDNKREL
jgi:heptosyltransferase II